MSVNTKDHLYSHTKLQQNIPSHLGEMDLNARVYVNSFRVDVNFQTGHYDLIPLQIFFFILISIDINVQLILHIKFQPFWRKCDFISFASFFLVFYLVSTSILNSRPD